MMFEVVVTRETEMAILRTERAMVSRAVAAAPQTPNWGGPHCQKGPQIVLKDPKLHQFKNKVLLGESR